MLVPILGANTEIIINGVTCTKNGDGTYTVNGTATDTCEFRIGTIKLSSGIYKTVGCPSGGSSSKYRNYVTNINTGISSEGGNGDIFTLLEDSNDIRFYIRIERGVTVSNLLFKPMITMDITATYDDFEPYQEHIATFYMDEPPRDGDKLVQIDDVLQVERNSAVYVVDLSDENTPISIVDKYENVTYFSITKPTDYKGYGDYANNPILCSRFIYGIFPSWDDSSRVGIICSHGGIKEFYCGMPKGTTLEEIRAIGKTEIEYHLATPTYEVLDTTSQIALNSLKSFNGVTYVEVDSRVKPQEVSFDYGTSHVGAITLKNELRENIRDIKMKELESKYEELAALINGGNSGEPTEPVDLDETGETEGVEPTTE